ncbi:Uncharacterised protein [Vibrio cholerae]|nr:Uncharacterised protein [Vibrio cholerae]
MPNQPPNQPSKPFNRAITLTKASKVAPTATAIFTPDIAPSAIASTTLVDFGRSNSSCAIAASTCSVSGNMIFAIKRPAGADMKAAAIR